MPRRRWQALLVAVATVAAGLTVAATPRAGAADLRDSFVTRCGIRFCLDGRAYYVAGTNTYDVFTMGFDWLPGEQYVDKPRIDAHMARLQRDGVSVLRLWMFSHEEWQGFEAREGVYTEEEFILFDYVIKSARDHNLRLIPVFENFWEAYGGIDTRLAWEGLPTGYANRWRFFNKQACPGCFEQYRNYVRYALGRTNFFTGVRWVDEPTIFAWELMNEPRYPDATPNENTTGTTLRAWVDEMGSLIKSLDANHLLGTGMEGQESRYGYGGDAGNPFIHIHSSPYIDFTSGHMYPTEGWAGLDMAEARALLRQWISDSHNVVGKPFFFGEFNVHENKPEWWRQLFAELEASGGDGSAYWWYPSRSGGCGGFDSGEGCAEVAVFSQHSAAMKAKSGIVDPSPSPSSSRSSVSFPASPSPSGTAACRVTYTVDSSWPDGFVAAVQLTNAGTSPLSSWTLTWTAAPGQGLVNGWGATVSQSGNAVTAAAPSWAQPIGPGASWTVGYQGSGPASPAPAGFALDGRPCSTGQR